MADYPLDRYGRSDDDLRPPTNAECLLARDWVARHRWTNPLDADVEYWHALSILVFADARPPVPWKREQLNGPEGEPAIVARQITRAAFDRGVAALPDIPPVEVCNDPGCGYCATREEVRR